MEFTKTEKKNICFTEDSTAFILRVGDGHESSIENIVTYFKQWLPSVSTIYKNQVTQQRFEKKATKIKEREAELRRLESERRIAEKLRALI